MRTTTECSEMPTKLDPETTHLVVSPNKLSVKYPNDVEYIVGLVRANKPVRANPSMRYYYFEMRVKHVSSNKGANASIGYSTTTEGLSSVEYRGSYGDVLAYPTRIFKSCSTYTTNDVVGAGIDYTSNQFFFTKNGDMVARVSKDFDGPLFPTVCLRGSNEEVKVNFGQKPFAYDDMNAMYPCRLCCHSCPVSHDSKPETTNDDSKPAASDGESWKTLMEKSEILLKKSIEEKEKEVASLKAVVNALSDNFQKYK